MGELKRAAQELGVTSTILRQHGWMAASPGRIEAVKNNPPDWLITARERHQQKQAAHSRAHGRARTAARLGVQVRAVRERDIQPDQVAGLLANQPEWLLAERARREAQRRREAKDRLRRPLEDALVGSVKDAWFQELKHATTEQEAAAIDARWALEVERAQREARQLVDELTEEQVRARITREEEASRAAAVFRARQVLRRALNDSDRG